MINWIIGVALAGIVAWAAIRAARRARKGGGCCGEHETVARRRSSRARPGDLPYAATLTIGGMTCENCARRVENALNALEGVSAKVRVDDHTARVRCQTPPDEARLRQAVREAGYVVTGIEK